MVFSQTRMAPNDERLAREAWAPAVKEDVLL
jgi:hypothetical protein